MQVSSVTVYYVIAKINSKHKNRVIDLYEKMYKWTEILQVYT